MHGPRLIITAWKILAYFLWFAQNFKFMYPQLSASGKFFSWKSVFSQLFKGKEIPKLGTLKLGNLKICVT